MLQISHTENPICSATIDQIRLRRAMVLPVAFQNASSSGLQSEIQVGLSSLIGKSLSLGRRDTDKSRTQRGTLGESPRLGGVTDWLIACDGVDGVRSGISNLVPTTIDKKRIT